MFIGFSPSPNYFFGQLSANTNAIQTCGTGCTGSATAVASNGLSPYDYLWSDPNTQTSATATNLCSGNYTVSVTDAAECLATQTVTISVNTLPTPNFTFNQFDNCEDLSPGVTFTNTSINATSYSWNFDDGTPFSTAFSPDYVFTFPGYFHVTLTASNSCGSASIAKDIYITPATISYNPHCCINYFSNAANDLLLDVSTVWSGVNYNFKGTLTLESGITLTISNHSRIAFGPQGKIVVKPGATLILDGSKLTAIDYSSVCPAPAVAQLMWQGIEVWGVAANSGSLAQGKVILQGNKPVIEFAHNAITLGKWTLKPNYPEGYQYNEHTSSSGGGIVQVLTGQAYFTRNGVSLRFWEYGYNNYSKISNTIFSCSQDPFNLPNAPYAPLPDPYYNSSNPANYSLPQIRKHNPFLASPQGNPTGCGVYSIYQYKVKNILFHGNIFKYAKTAIYSADAKYNVNGTSPGLGGNYFYDVGTGISMNGSLAAYYGNQISDNFFRNFSAGIIIGGSKSIVIRDNSFNTASPTTQSQNMTGIALSYSQQFTIVDNNFNQLGTGIMVANSGQTVASIIGRQKTGQQAGNLFTRCSTGIQTQSNNNFLSIRCNQHMNPGIISDVYYKSWNNLGTLGDQGKSIIIGQSYSINKSKPAGSRFQNNIVDPLIQPLKEIKGSQNFTYQHHRLSTALSNEYRPKQDGAVILQPNDVDCPSSQFPCCPPAISGNSGSMLLSEVQSGKTQLSILNNEFISTVANLDKGQRAALLQAISLNTPEGALKNMLLNASPLSDTVLVSFINRQISVSPGIFKQVMVGNSPVSEEIKPQLDQKLNSLPSGISKQISDAQLSNPGVRTLTAIARDMVEIEKQSQLLINEAVSTYIENDSLTSAISLLDQENVTEIKQGLTATYLAEGNLTAATTKFATLPINNAEDAAFVELYSVYINLEQQGKTLWEMDSIQLQTTQTIASLCPASVATVNAQTVLRLLFEQEFEDCPLPSSRMVGQNERENERGYLENRINMLFWKIYPNPNNGKMNFLYKLGEEEKGELLIRDATGTLIASFKLNAQNNSISFDKVLANGIYFYSVKVNEETIHSDKLVIIK